MRLSLKTTLYLLISPLLVILTIVLFSIFSLVIEIERNALALELNIFQVIQAEKFSGHLTRQLQEYADFILTGLQKEERELDRSRKEATESLDRLFEGERERGGKEEHVVSDIIETYAKFNQIGEQVHALTARGKRDEAIVMMEQKLEPFVETFLFNKINDFINENERTFSIKYQYISHHIHDWDMIYFSLEPEINPIEEIFKQIIFAGQFSRFLGQQVRTYVDFVLTGERSDELRMEQAKFQAKMAFSQLKKKLNTEQESDVLAEIEASYDKLNQIGQQVLLLANKGRKDRAMVLVEFSIEPMMEATLEKLEYFILGKEDRIRESTHQLAVSVGQEKVRLGIVSLLFLVIGVASPKLLSRKIINPILRLKDAVSQVQLGNLDVNADIPESSEVGQLAQSFNEMTQRLKRVRDQLLSEKKYSENIVQSMNDSLILVSSDGTIRTSNNATYRLLGYEKDELIGHSVGNIFMEEFLLEESGHHKFIKKELLQNKETLLIAKNGTKIPVLLSGSIIKKNDREEFDFIFVCRDITKRKKTQMDLEQKKLALEELTNNLRQLSARLADEEESSRKKFAGILHEEVGQNLAAIRIMVFNLQKSPDTDLTQTIKSREELLSLLDEAIESTRELTTGLYPTILDSLGLISSIKWIKDLTQKKHRLRVSLDLDLRVELLRSKSKISLFRIIQEAVQNAVKHASSTELFINLKSDRSICKLLIQDNGIGFDVNSSKKIQDKGIGLMLIRERVLSLRGTFKIESSLGKGTKIMIEIPPEQSQEYGHLSRKESHG